MGPLCRLLPFYLVERDCSSVRTCLVYSSASIVLFSPIILHEQFCFEMIWEQVSVYFHPESTQFWISLLFWLQLLILVLVSVAKKGCKLCSPVTTRWHNSVIWNDFSLFMDAGRICGCASFWSTSSTKISRSHYATFGMHSTVDSLPRLVYLNVIWLRWRLFQWSIYNRNNYFILVNLTWYIISEMYTEIVVPFWPYHWNNQTIAIRYPRWNVSPFPSNVADNKTRPGSGGMRNSRCPAITSRRLPLSVRLPQDCSGVRLH